jgi:CHAD domain-containing protein
MKAGIASARQLEAPLRAVLRKFAVAHLTAAARARARLKNPEDGEALHDFRVALRRLRSLLRAYQPYAEIVPKKLRRRLRRIARATTAARDAEVQLDWLRHARLPTEARAAGAWLAERLRNQRNAAYDALPDEAIEPFDRLQAGLRRTFTPMPDRRRAGADFSGVTARVLAEHAEALTRAVSAVGSLRDETVIHAARIEGKRLRYLIEPLAPAIPGARALVRRMKAFQDRFGELCDLFVLARAIEAAAGETSAENAQRRAHQAWLGETVNADDPAASEAGLLALVRCVRGSAERLYASIERDYQGERIAGLAESVSALVQRLLTPPRPRRRVRRRAA